MKKNVLGLALCAAMTLGAASCLKDDDYEYDYDTFAVVTIWPEADSFKLQLDDSTVLRPTNVTASPYGDKVVRAYAGYRVVEETAGTKSDSVDESVEKIITKNIKLSWVDSILTKKPVQTLGDKDDDTYGTAPIEILNDWSTVAEDGFLTLSVRTISGAPGTAHYVNLVTGSDPDDPFVLTLRHKCDTSYSSQMFDGILAFNLNDLPHTSDEVKIKLKWTSFTGVKTEEFSLKMHKE